MKLKLILASMLVIFAAACERNVSSAERTETVSLSGTVTEIDSEARRFIVKDGTRLTTFRASEQVKNFTQLAVGDEITLEYIESVAVSMAAPGSELIATGESMAAVAAEGQKPGAAVGDLITLTVEFLAYNTNNNVATIKLPDGNVVEVKVQPEIQSFAASRTPGDLVVVQMFQAVAVMVLPAG
ncbi:MAG: hypothetical protein ACU0CA_13855 [Paracoccaceae bacterium]